MNKQIKLYNVIFPVWILFLFPPIILLIIPGNFLIDSIIFLLSLKLLKIKEKSIYKKSIIKIYIFGFLSDIAGSLFIFSSYLTKNDNLIKGVSYNPYKNVFSIIYIILAIIISSLLIFYLNYKFSFKNTKLNKKNKRYISIILAIFTAPYMFLIPTNMFYKEKVNSLNNQLNLFEKNYKNFYIGDNSKTINAFEDAVNITNASINLDSEPYHINDYTLEVRIRHLIDKDSMNKIGLLLLRTSNNMNELKFIDDSNDYVVTKKNINRIYNSKNIKKIFEDNEKLTDDSFKMDFKYYDNYLIGIEEGLNENDFYDMGGNDKFIIIPKYKDIKIDLYEQSLNESGEMDLVFKKTFDNTFSIKCNPSDLYSNIVLNIRYKNKIYSYSPYYNLKDGSLFLEKFVNNKKSI